MNKQLDPLKKAYDEIVIPEQLAAVTEAAIVRARNERKRQRQKRTNRWVTRLTATAAGLFILFAVSVNTMPALASSLEDVPGLGKLVRILQFNKGSAGGGVITDSTDINVISLQKKDDLEHIAIHFQQNNQNQQHVNSFSVHYSEYPNTMTFAIGGVRRFTAEKDLAALLKSDLIEDAYLVVSLDDSLVRFNITLKKNVVYEVKEFKEPAQVVLTLKPNISESKRPPVYSVRTASSPFGESQGIYEEMLLGIEGVRTLKDRQGTFFVEAGYYGSEAEAKTMLDELKTKHGFTDNLYIDKREALQVPEAINIDETVR